MPEHRTEKLHAIALDQTALADQTLLGNDGKCGKDQIWCAVSTYVPIAIVKKELHLNASLYTLLQLLSASVFEKTEISCALQPDTDRVTVEPVAKQLILFDF